MYAAYVDSFPGIVMIFTAGISLLGSLASFYLFTQRHRMRGQEEEIQRIPKNPEVEQTSL